MADGLGAGDEGLNCEPIAGYSQNVILAAMRSLFQENFDEKDFRSTQVGGDLRFAAIYQPKAGDSNNPDESAHSELSDVSMLTVHGDISAKERAAYLSGFAIGTKRDYRDRLVLFSNSDEEKFADELGRRITTVLGRRLNGKVSCVDTPVFHIE